MSEERLNELEIQNAELEQKVSMEEKKALIARAKQKYGTDYKKFITNFGNNSKGSGIDWNLLRFRI